MRKRLNKSLFHKILASDISVPWLIRLEWTVLSDADGLSNQIHSSRFGKISDEAWPETWNGTARFPSAEEINYMPVGQMAETRWSPLEETRLRAALSLMQDAWRYWRPITWCQLQPNFILIFRLPANICESFVIKLCFGRLDWLKITMGPKNFNARDDVSHLLCASSIFSAI